MIKYHLEDVRQAYEDGRDSARKGFARPALSVAHDHPLMKAFEQGYYDESLTLLVSSA